VATRLRRVAALGMCGAIPPLPICIHGVVLGEAQEYFTFIINCLICSTQPPVQWVAGVLNPGVKRAGREADHSPPSSAEVKND